MDEHERNLYLSNIDLDKAQKMFLDEVKDCINSVGKEVVKVEDALGRITTNPVFAKVSSPNFNAAAMDGIAVKAISTFEANEKNPVRLKLDKDFIYIDTGDVIKKPYDAVIMIEDVVVIDDETVEIIKATSPWQHIRPVGEDLVASEMIIPAYHKIRPMDIGALLSGGILEISIFKKPRVGIIPTGTEIVEPSERLPEGKIIDSNSRMFEALILEYGAVPNRYSPIKDDYDLIKEKILMALEENDIVVVNAGSSAGTEDYTPKIIKDLGKLIAHGIAIKPGKPTILGKVKGKPVVGVPGYPVSAFLAFDSFVKPLVYEYTMQNIKKRKKAGAILSKRIVSSIKHQEFVRMKLGKVGGKLIATPLNRGAGVTMSLVKADGILRIAKNIEGLESGEEVEIELLKDMDSIENTIVSIGSHDIMLDILSNIFHTKYPGNNLSSAHVGSLGGIMAIKKGECHIAPVHLLDEKTGTYNLEYMKKYFRNKDVVLIKGVKRVQGLIVNKGNPKNINSIDDLRKDNIVFVNRQKGSGTRILLNYILKQNDIDPSEIAGYNREMTTHMTVASAVKCGTADIGVGIKSVANVMNLDFIPIGEEEYDFIIKKRFLYDEKVKNFINVLKSDRFKNSLEKLGGYIVDIPGEIVDYLNITKKSTSSTQ